MIGLYHVLIFGQRICHSKVLLGTIEIINERMILLNLMEDTISVYGSRFISFFAPNRYSRSLFVFGVGGCLIVKFLHHVTLKSCLMLKFISCG